MKFLAVDIGASSGRTIVATIENNAIEMDETHRFENSMVDVEGSKRWDVEALVEEIKSGIAKSGDVDAIGLDTWGVDYGLIDADGELLEMPYAYRDSRHELGIAMTQMLVDKVDLYKRNGLQEMPFNTIFQLMAQKEANFDLIKKRSGCC